jgi:hypothetical protein
MRWTIRAAPCGHVQAMQYLDDGRLRVVVTWPPDSRPICGECRVALCGFEAEGETAESPPTRGPAAE